MSLERHSLLTERTHRSENAFRFGLRGGSRRLSFANILSDRKTLMCNSFADNPAVRNQDESGLEIAMQRTVRRCGLHVPNCSLRTENLSMANYQTGLNMVIFELLIRLPGCAPMRSQN
jgi:hypothetical protein